MKTKGYIFFMVIFFSSTIALFAQSGMTIKSGGAVTVNGSTIIIPCIATPTTGTHIPSATQIIWKWNTVTGASGYKWNMVNDYNTSIDMGTANTKTETGLLCNFAYTRYAWAYGTCGNSTPVVMTQTTSFSLPAAPSAGTHIPSATEIIWNWNAVIGATGYKWNTVNDYNTAIELGTATTKKETGLTCNAGYTRYVWSYSACGNSASTMLTQVTSECPCGTSFTDPRDGKTYSTVLIGTQCWMAQNLNIGTRITGYSNQTNNGIIQKYCYNNDENKCNIFGGLYQWNEAMQYSTTPGVQGICPAGWHVPADAEWTTLTTFLGGESIAGGKMKSTGTIQAGTGLWNSPNTNATNNSGFTALPGGEWEYFGDFWDLSNYAHFWASTEVASLNARTRTLDHYAEYVSRGSKDKMDHGYSIRCVRD